MSLAKMLFVIMLVVRWTMGTATADLPPEDAPRTLQASDTLYVDLTPLALRQKRYLRSAVNMMTITTEELNKVSEVGVDGLKSLVKKQETTPSATLRRSVKTIPFEDMSRFRRLWWLLCNRFRTPERVFMSLKLDEGKKPLENPLFSLWEYFVKKTTREIDVTKVMIKAMVNALGGEKKLAEILLQGKTSERKSICDKARYLLSYQTHYWVRDSYTPEAVFKLLGLNDKKNIKENRP
ncbi:hypothetical protein DD238_006067 [Peronospora effusa]|uniref:RxLR effector protein n=1 Tax=Peronospora effusa TaxID=542832 RepID=A0A3M6VC03_9STRA|nr:hypothetical protein DD238_006067 [Peronospora effusa]